MKHSFYRFSILLVVQMLLVVVVPVAWFVTTERLANKFGYITQSEQAEWVEDHYEVTMNLLPGHRNYIENNGEYASVFGYAYSCNRGIMLDQDVSALYSGTDAFGRCAHSINEVTTNIWVEGKMTFTLVSYALNDYRFALSEYLPFLQKPVKTYFQSDVPFTVVQKRTPISFFEVEMFICWLALWILGFLVATWLLWKDFVRDLVMEAELR